VSTNDKAAVVALLDRMPESATLHDVAREIGRLAEVRAAREGAAAGSWIFGEASRLEFHQIAHERAVRFVEQFLPLFSRGK